MGLLSHSSGPTGSFGRMGELHRIIQKERKGTGGLLQIGVEHDHIGTFSHIEVESKV